MTGKMAGLPILHLNRKHLADAFIQSDLQYKFSILCNFKRVNVPCSGETREI